MPSILGKGIQKAMEAAQKAKEAAKKQAEEDKKAKLK